MLRLPADELAAELAGREAIKGEIALVIAPPSPEEQQVDLQAEDVQERIRRELEGGTSKSALAKQLARELGISKNQVYDLIHSL